jgi:hypothetical protein
MTCFYLWCFDNLADIIALVTIILTILTSDGLLGRETDESENRVKRKRLRSDAIIWIVIITLVISYKSTDTHGKYTIVPNLYGLTYDDAMKALIDKGLEGQLVLAETSKDLQNSDSRVVWQSAEAQGTENVGEIVSFLIDDCFSLKSTPLNEYMHRKDEIQQTEKLNYICDYKDPVKQSVEQQQAAMESGEPVRYSFEDSHWEITVDSADIRYEIRSLYIDDMPYYVIDSFYSYNNYSGKMSVTLEDIVEESLKRVAGDADSILDPNDTIVGKMTPLSEQQNTALRSITVPNHKGVFLLPQTLVCGDYRFDFAIIESDDAIYEWYHTITIEDNEDVT